LVLFSFGLNNREMAVGRQVDVLLFLKFFLAMYDFPQKEEIQRIKKEKGKGKVLVASSSSSPSLLQSPPCHGVSSQL